jgi:hypothetical protein
MNSSNKKYSLNKDSSQEKIYNYSSKNSINSSNKKYSLNKGTSQENISEFNYSNKNSSNINSSKKDFSKININYNDISRKNSQISNKYIEKKKLLIINFQNADQFIKKDFQSYVEGECNINSINKNQIEFVNMNYDEYQKDKEEEDFFKIYFIFIFVLENELYKNADKILEIEDDIENYNPFIKISVITVNGEEKNSYFVFPQMPFSDYTEIINKYENYKERKNDSKYKIITYYPEFYVYKEKDNKIIVNIFYPYVFSDFSNAKYEDILSVFFNNSFFGTKKNIKYILKKSSSSFLF